MRRIDCFIDWWRVLGRGEEREGEGERGERERGKRVPFSRPFNGNDNSNITLIFFT